MHDKKIAAVYFALFFILVSCSKNKPQYTSFNQYPTPVEQNLWLAYTPKETTFKLWSPVAEAVKLKLYEQGNGGEAYKTKTLKEEDDGVWQITVEGNLDGVYYTYQVKAGGQWLAETPGIYATATGVNGQRAMVLDMQRTNPIGWETDKRAPLNKPNEAIIYELHVRDLTIHANAGSSHAGKYTGLSET